MPKTTKVTNTTYQTSILDTYTPESLKVLITRPKDKAQQLALLLDEQGISNHIQTLFNYQPSGNIDEIAPAIKQADTIIFVSVAAVNFAHKIQPLKFTANQHVFAVGNATKQALLALGISQVLSPPSQAEHSEGLLNLNELLAVKDKTVLIFRGKGGREHLANTLQERGAKVTYIECYQRVWRELPPNTALQWQAQQINCIVVTSNDILVAIHKLINSDAATMHYWQTKCLWLVVSERIKANATALGFTQVINTQGASSKNICNTLQSLSCS